MVGRRETGEEHDDPAPPGQKTACRIPAAVAVFTEMMVMSRNGGRILLLMAAAVFGLQGVGSSGPARALPEPVAGETAVAVTREDSAAAILIPVLGVSGSALQDTWGEARSGGRTHQAIDIPAERGTPVVAVIDGVVLKLFQSGAGGTTLYLTDQDRALLYYYAHLDGYADGLHEGMAVSRGTILGFVGSTGNAPEHFPHLHFSIEQLPESGEWWKGEPMNPYPILVGATPAQTGAGSSR
jgi:peptidoglycan LD-endopeptidase LytH